ncbi:MAG: hypothetical protein QW379_03300 [Thermoplasmata archaeon]
MAMKTGRRGGEAERVESATGGSGRLRVYCAGPMRSGGKYVDNFHEMVRIVEELGHLALTELSGTVEWGELGGLSEEPGGHGKFNEKGEECRGETAATRAGEHEARGGRSGKETDAGAKETGEGAAFAVLDGEPGGRAPWPRSIDAYIYERDLHWLRRADALVAEVSGPSLGVGYEISYALHVRRIPVLCLCHREVHSLSAMISGNTSPLMRLERYGSGDEMRAAIRAFLEEVR